MSRYATGTTVPVDKSRGDISGILARYGVERQGWVTGPDGDELMFELNGKRYRFQINKPTLEDAKRSYLDSGKSEWGWNHQADQETWKQKEWMRRWRANVLLIKAKLEFADGGDTTLEREFMPYMLVDGKRTLGELVEAGVPLLGKG